MVRAEGGSTVVEGTKRGCGRRSEDAEEGEKKKTKDKEVATREKRERRDRGTQRG